MPSVLRFIMAGLHVPHVLCFIMAGVHVPHVLCFRMAAGLGATGSLL